MFFSVLVQNSKWQIIVHAVSNILPSNCWYTKVGLINAAVKFCMANKNVQTMHRDFSLLIKYQQILEKI